MLIVRAISIAVVQSATLARTAANRISLETARLRYTLVLLADSESADGRCDNSLIATITHTFAATATLTIVTTARAPVNDVPKIYREIEHFTLLEFGVQK